MLIFFLLFKFAGATRALDLDKTAEDIDANLMLANMLRANVIVDGKDMPFSEAISYYYETNDGDLTLLKGRGRIILNRILESKRVEKDPKLGGFLVHVTDDKDEGFPDYDDEDVFITDRGSIDFGDHWLQAETVLPMHSQDILYLKFYRLDYEAAIHRRG